MATMLASVGSTFRDFTDAAAQFFDNLTQLKFGSLGLALVAFLIYLLLRSRATFNALRAAYPERSFQWRRIWGAYVAAYGLNGVVPAGGGSVVQLMLTRLSIDKSSYATVTSAIALPVLFDSVVCAGLLGYAFLLNGDVFPAPNAFKSLESFDLAFFGRHPQLTLFIVTAVVALLLIGFALLSRRIAALWSEVRQGWSMLRQPRRYLLGMCVPQLLAWTFRGVTYYFLLDAFHVGASIRGALLVLAVQVIAAIVPFTPGGAGAQQALLLVIFSSTATTDSVAVFSVGQQIAIVALALALAFAAIFFIFRYRSFGAVMRASREFHASERLAAREAGAAAAAASEPTASAEAS
jgi:uncharacterized membrane protein YbhN (UPF0104 family)